MAGTRTSTGGSSSPSNRNETIGTKRKAESASPQRERKTSKKQTTLEEIIQDDDVNDAPDNGETKVFPADAQRTPGIEEDEDVDAGSKDQEDAGKSATSADAILESPQREEKLPSNILEKGVIYFFTRNRVGLEDAESVGDLQRTFFVLRPLPVGAKLNDGALPDSENIRLFALPKKVFPKSHNDRFMAFVEKAQTSIQDLKENFFKAEDYQTKTVGARQTAPVTTVAEGVYAITRTEDRTTHLAYAITIPSDLGEVQEDLGLRTQGSFIISVKNPERRGPANAQLPQKPAFPKEIIEEFRGLAWSEVKPKYLDYANTQILLIGEKLESATEPTTKDQKHGKDGPKEELDQLEHEDELRVQHLHGDESVFADLQISKDDYPKVPTTW